MNIPLTPIGRPSEAKPFAWENVLNQVTAIVIMSDTIAIVRHISATVRVLDQHTATPVQSQPNGAYICSLSEMRCSGGGDGLPNCSEIVKVLYFLDGTYCPQNSFPLGEASIIRSLILAASNRQRKQYC